MGSIGWRFPPLSGGTRQGYTNNDIEVFKGQELMDNLAREICQNSLDAKQEGVDLPVKVIFELMYVDTNKYDVFSGYRECLKGCREFWGDEMDVKLSHFVCDAEETLSKEKVPILVVGDYNTKGLSGNHNGKLSAPWEALTGSDGMSVKSDNNSGGSYGIGKNAPFACSSLSMVFYNTQAENEESAFIGVARLATLLNKEGKPTQRVGKYQNNDDNNEKWLPIYPEDNNVFRDLFIRKERGTDVIVVGFNQEKNWMNNVTKAVMKNFFVAICEGRLVVELKDGIKNRIIDSDNITQLFSDFSDDREILTVSQLYKAFTAPDTKEMFEVLEPNDVEVYIKSDSSFQRTIANFRTTGMMVGSYYRRIFQHYAAVVIVRGRMLGELLKDTEPPRHNRWDYKLINESDRERRKTAKDAIQKIDATVLNLLKNQFEIITEDTVDAAGVGEYIPDEEDGLGGASEGDDILKVKIKIGKIKTNTTRTGTMTVSGVKEVGGEEEGDVHNHNKNPNPMPPKPHPPKPVDPDNLENEQREGVAQGNGIKSMIMPNILAQRAFPINSSQGLYKLVIKPAQRYENIYIECLALGEDGRSDLLEMESFTYNGKSINIRDSKAGPIQMDEDVASTFFVKFKNKEKMVLRLRMTEVIKK